MKLVSCFAVLGLVLGMSAYMLRPHWLQATGSFMQLLKTDALSSVTAAADPAGNAETAFVRVQQQLIEYAEAQLCSGAKGLPEQSTTLGHYVQQLKLLRDQLADADGSKDRLLMHALFAAAKVCPAEHGAPFEEFVGERVTEAIEPEVAAEASMLKFLIKHPLQTEVTQDVLYDLREFARAYPKSGWGISLFSAAASQLWLAKQSESAEQVLTLGLQLYEEHPGCSDLVRQLVDQGHRPPPECQISAADWKLMERAIDSRRGTARPAAG